MPATDEMRMIAPSPALRIIGSARRQRKYAAWTWTSNVAFHCSGEHSSIVPSDGPPAEWTRISSPPRPASASRTSRSTSSGRATSAMIETHLRPVAAIACFDCGRRLIVVPAVDRDVATLPREVDGNRRADALGAARDQSARLSGEDHFN